MCSGTGSTRSSSTGPTQAAFVSGGPSTHQIGSRVQLGAQTPTRSHLCAACTHSFSHGTSSCSSCPAHSTMVYVVSSRHLSVIMRYAIEYLGLGFYFFKWLKMKNQEETSKNDHQITSLGMEIQLRKDEQFVLRHHPSISIPSKVRPHLHLISHNLCI